MSLDYIVENGGVITDAVSTQDWPGEAVVDVSIVNWVQAPPRPPDDFMLDGDEVRGIKTRLLESPPPIEEYEAARPNAGRAFQGPIPAGSFYLDADEDSASAGARCRYTRVVRPYLMATTSLKTQGSGHGDGSSTSRSALPGERYDLSPSRSRDRARAREASTRE